ncbi:MAG: Mur ligase family protein [Candidatus Shapirobacteria bacterium]|nr:Mur ligase family protein [Candidatus Shapirobacteria bacterium]
MKILPIINGYKISYFRHRRCHLPLPQANLYIVGTSVHKFAVCQQEYDYIIKNNLPYISSTEFLAQNIIKPESILIAGSYGKTTISAFLSWLFVKLDLNPSYFFGGNLIEDFPSLSTGNGQFSIVEADESINGLDTQAKFLYYPVKYLIITSTNWEHKDSYKTAEDNFNAYKQLVEKLPQDGILVYNPNDPEIQKLLPFSKAKNIPYQSFDFETKLIGKFNRENINAALTLCSALGFDKAISLVPDFKGISRRLEIIHHNPLVIDDFAQSPDRIKSTLNTVSETYPNRPIKVFFEPHASFLSYKSSLNGMSPAFKSATEVIISKIKFNPSISNNDRTTFADYKAEIGDKVKYLPLLDNIKQYLQQSLKPDDILIHFSSGGLDGLNTLNQIVYTFN